MRVAPRLYALVLFLHAEMPFFGYLKDEDAVKDHSIQIRAAPDCLVRTRQKSKKVPAWLAWLYLLVQLGSTE